MTLRLRWLLLASLVVVLPVVAQDKPPTPEELQALKAKFEAERADALAKKFPANSLERADEQAKRADDAVKAGTPAAAARFYREARWLIPYVPTDLPPNVERVLGIARMRHGDVIYGLAYAPDGSKVASASKDGTVKVWDLGNGRELRTYRGSKDPVRAVAWADNGKTIASTAGNEIHLWDAVDGKLQKALKGHEKAVGALAFQPGSQWLVSGSDDTTVRVWDLAKGEEYANLNGDFNSKARAQIYSVAFSPNGKLVASVNGNGQLQIWNPSLEKKARFLSGLEAHPSTVAYQVAFGKDTSVVFTTGNDNKAKQFVGLGPDGETIAGHGRPTPLEGHTNSVTALAVSKDGKFVATGSSDKTIRLWDMSSPTPRLARVYQGHSEEVTALAFAPDHKTLISASADQSLRVWSVSLSDDHLNLEDSKGAVWSAAFSSDGALVASGGVDRIVYVRDPSGKIVHKLEGHTAAITAIAFSPDNTKIASVGGDMIVRLWDAKEGKKLKEFKGHTAPIMAIAFGGDSKTLLTGGIDKVVRLWDVAKDEPVQSFPANRSAISSVALRADGKQALVGSADGAIRVYDLTAAVKELSNQSAHLSGVGALAYSPDGQRLASCGGEGSVKYWSLNATGTPTLVNEFKGHTKPVSSVAFSADGRFVVSGGGDMIVRVWDLNNKTELRALRGHMDWISSVAFGPNGRTLLSCGVDKTTKVWELSSGETAKPIGHTRKLNTIAVSADGRWVASGSEDRTIKVWDAVAGTEVCTFDAAAGGHDSEITALAFHPSGKKLVSAADDRRIVIWDIDTRKAVQTMVIDQRMPYMLYALKGDRFVVWQNTTRNDDNEINNIKTYDPDGKPLNSLEIKDRKIQCLTFSFDGEMVVMGHKDGSVRMWKLTNNEKIGGDWPAFEKDLGDLAVTPDKKKVIAADIDCNVKIYDIEKKEVLKKFQAHKAGLNGVMVGPNGDRFVTIADNNEVKLWKTDTGEELRSWTLATPVRNIAFSADGKKLITANGDSTLYVLNLP